MSPPIQFLFQLQTDCKMYHWQTRSASNHKTIGDLYNTIIGISDEMIEVSMGRYGRPRMPSRALVRVRNMTKKSMLKALKDAQKRLDTLEIPPGAPDLVALRDELVAAVSKALYLMTLK